LSLLDVLVYTVPADLANRTERTLKAAGREGHELFVLWSGQQHAETFEVRSGHVPLQTSYKTSDGLCVKVDGEALHDLNAWLYAAGETLAVQLHCHPKKAYHSRTDDTFPIVTAVGGASVVVPYFCRSGLLASGTAIYRLTDSRWVRSEAEARNMIQVLM
jgi:hypothetical protein